MTQNNSHRQRLKLICQNEIIKSKEMIFHKQDDRVWKIKKKQLNMAIITFGNLIEFSFLCKLWMSCKKKNPIGRFTCLWCLTFNNLIFKSAFVVRNVFFSVVMQMRNINHKPLTGLHARIDGFKFTTKIVLKWYLIPVFLLSKLYGNLSDNHVNFPWLVWK